MHAHRSNGFAISLTLHALFAALIFFTTYVLANRAEDAPKIFDLVQGPPTNIYSTQAPKKGNTQKEIKLEIPEMEDDGGDAGDDIPTVDTTPEPAPTPPAPAPKPVVKETPSIVPPKIPTKTPKKTVETKRTADTKSKQSDQPKKSSYEEFLKKNPKMAKNMRPISNSSGKSGASHKRIDATGIANGVKEGSSKSKDGAGGTALTREEADKMDTYISYLVQEIQRLALEDSAGMSDQLVAKVTFDISAGGTISNPRIERSSGNKEFDEFALSVFRRMRNTGPTPDRRAHTWSINFTMKPD